MADAALADEVAAVDVPAAVDVVAAVDAAAAATATVGVANTLRIVRDPFRPRPRQCLKVKLLSLRRRSQHPPALRVQQARMARRASAVDDVGADRTALGAMQRHRSRANSGL